MDNDKLESSLVSVSSSKTGLDMVCEVNEVYVEGSKELLKEMMSLGGVLAASAIYAFGIKNVVKFLNYAIIILAKVIKTVIEKLFEMYALFKKTIDVMAAQLESTNTALPSNDYIDVEFKEIREALEYQDQSVTINGYRMDFDIDTILSRLSSENYGAYDAIYFSLLNESKDIFESRDHMLSLIAEKRANILKVPSVSSKMTTVEFADALKRVVFGPDNVQITYTYKDAKNLSKNNRSKATHIQNLLKTAIVDARNGLKALDKKKAEIQRNPESSTESIKNNFQLQLNWLIEYRTTIMKDQIMIFETLIKYIKTVSTQAKLIRAKAIETQWEG